MRDIVGRRKLWFTIPCVVLVVTLVASLVFGVELDINFRGGSLVTYSFEGSVDKGQFEDTIQQAFGQQISVQEQQDVVTGRTNYVANLSVKEGISPDQQIAITSALQEKFPDNKIEVVSTSNVDPAIGRDFFVKSMVAVAAAAVLMILYIAYRFRRMGGWSAGVFSVVALLHDVMYVFAAFVLVRFPIGDSCIAVALTLLGYSINATIVVYDRIRENKRLLGSKVTVDEVVNVSINQSLTRSINTTVSTVIAMGTVCVISVIYHVESILVFSLPMLIGMVAGAYSSVCLAGPLWATWQNYKAAQNKQK